MKHFHRARDYLRLGQDVNLQVGAKQQGHVWAGQGRGQMESGPTMLLVGQRLMASWRMKQRSHGSPLRPVPALGSLTLTVET